MRLAALMIASALVIAACDAKAQLQPQMVSILAARDAGGWRIDVEVEGLGVTSASFTPPGQPPLLVPCESGTGVILCERVEPPLPGPGAVTLAALLAQFPAGSWLVSVNDGTRTATVPFDPQEPDGLVTVTNPANGATNVSATPDVSYQNACSNCNFLELRIEDLATLGEVFEIGTLIAGSLPFPSGQVPFADFFEGAPQPLPDGDYRMMAAVGIGALETRSFDQGSFEFQYGSGAALQNPSVFRVPEPEGVGIAAVTALLAVSVLSRSRR